MDNQETPSRSNPAPTEKKFALTNGKHAPPAVLRLHGLDGLTAETLLAIQAQVLEMIATGRPLKMTLRTINQMTESLDTGLFCSTVLLDAVSGRLYHGDADGLPPAYNAYVEGLAIGPRVGACGTAAYYKEPVISSDIATDPLWDDYREIALSFGLRACWAVPIFSRNGSVLGTFAVYLCEPRSPSPAHLELLRSAAHLASVAIERQRSEEDRSHLAALVASSSDAILSFDLEGQIRTWNAGAERMFGYTAAEIVGRSCGELILTDATHEWSDCWQWINEGLARHELETVLVCKDGRPFTVLMSLSPISVGGVQIGSSCIARDITERKRAEAQLAQRNTQMSAMNLLQASLNAELSGLRDDLQRANAGLIEAYDATIEGWSRALDLRDQETEGHSRRVTITTLRLAERMGVTGDELLHIQRGALLHDIGKMGIPDAILLKNGDLTEEEWVIMRRHPVLAHELLLPIAFLRPALVIPLYHHERWDGTGYPDGLKGKNIPLPARLFAVADVWDALRSDRPYRKGWSREKVRGYIQEQARRHFDPAVVAAFLELLQADSVL